MFKVNTVLHIVWYNHRCHLRSFLTLGLLILALLELGAPLVSFLEEALYDCSI